MSFYRPKQKFKKNILHYSVKRYTGVAVRKRFQRQEARAKIKFENISDSANVFIVDSTLLKYAKSAEQTVAQFVLQKILNLLLDIVLHRKPGILASNFMRFVTKTESSIRLILPLPMYMM